jgi:hypothetical protein
MLRRLAVVTLCVASLSVATAALAAGDSAPMNARTGHAGALPPPSTPGEGEEMALLADFVEIGRVERSIAHDLAMVDLLNLSPHVLDVVVGDGAATLQPKERMIARVKAGDANVSVATREKGVDPMEGRLHLEPGVRYELAFAYGAVPKVQAEMATPGVDATQPSPASAGAAGRPAAAGMPAADVAPMPREASQPQQPRKEPRRTKGGKVDLGRHPRR